MAAAGIWLVFARGGLDFGIASVFYDSRSGGFPLQHDWWLSEVGHTGLQRTAIVFWLLCVVAAVVPSRWRRIAREAAVDMALAALVVTLLKQASAHSCPWDLAQFGGQAQWFPLFGALPEGSGPGRCLPAGHPVSGFALFGLYFALRRHKAKAAPAVLLAAIVLGMAASAVQVVRGAHFVSHALWTAWIAWTLCWSVHLLRLARQKRLEAAPIMGPRGASP